MSSNYLDSKQKPKEDPNEQRASFKRNLKVIVSKKIDEAPHTSVRRVTLQSDIMR